MKYILAKFITRTDRARIGRRAFASDASGKVLYESGSLPMAGPGGVVRLQPLAEREQLVLAQHGAAPLGPEPAHGPAAAARAPRQRARPRRVPRHRAPHHVAHAEAPPRPWRHTRLSVSDTHTRAHTLRCKLSRFQLETVGVAATI